MTGKTILVTSALPYANGPIHFGHIAGAYLPADVFARYHRLMRSDVIYICGTDEYGVAVAIGAEREKRTPREHVDLYHGVIRRIFEQFQISFDHFSRTTTDRHAKLSQQFFRELFENGHIEDREVRQHFCRSCDRYLADRYVQGTCYLCEFEGARGDECPRCGAWLEPLKLKKPSCKVCGREPEIRSTRHWFLKLSDFKGRLKKWFDEHPYWKPNVLNVAKKEVEKLESRPITRDLKWGIPVPHPEAAGKVLYVWFDAPIGYVDATMEWAEKTGDLDAWKRYWQNPDCRIVNFIGKDNIPFHLLVWPAMLMGQTTGYTLAENVPANEFLNLQGRQFSKSEGWTVDLETFFERYSADQIRYTLAAIAPENKDSDFTWKDFQKFNNADLADTLGNLVNRLVTFTRKRFEGGIPAAGDLSGPGAALLEDVRWRKAKIGELYDTHQLKKAAYEVIDLARLGNRFFDENRPWKTVKEDPAACGKTLFSLLRLLEQLAVCAWPIIPNAAESIFRQIGISRGVLETGWDFESALPPDGGHPLGEPSILFHKIEDEVIEAENRKLEEALARCGGKTENRTDYEPLEAEIEFPDFTRVDLRVGKVLRAEKLVKSKKLIKIEVDLGFETRQVVAGIAGSYEAGELPGRLVIVAANLKPRKLMGETSRGMILAAEREGTLKLLEVPEGQPGTRVH